MFTQYFGGGVGHLEQFPQADNDNGVTYKYEEEMAMDDTGAREAGKSGSGEGEDSSDEASKTDECSEPGESSDKEMGNRY